MVAKSLQILSLEQEKRSIDQRFGPLLEPSIRKKEADELIEMQKISKNFVQARHEYLESLVLSKMVNLPLLLFFISTVLSTLDDNSGLWRLCFPPILYVWLLIYCHRLKNRMFDMLKHFKRAASHVERDKPLWKQKVDVEGTLIQLSEIGEKALDNTIKAISLSRKGIPVTKNTSLKVTVGYGLFIATVLGIIGFVAGEIFQLFDPWWDSLTDVLALIVFSTALGMMALPHTEHNNLVQQLSGLIQDYCHYRDLCYRFDIVNVTEYNQRFIAELAEPNLFSSLPPEILIYENRRLL